MFRIRLLRVAACLCALSAATIAFGQTESASIGGRITDTTGAAIRGAEVQLLSIERGVATATVSNSTGIYSFSGVQPGRYNITARHAGFRQVDAVDIVLNVQAHLEENFRLQVGSIAESVTVTAEPPLLNTQDASVSTVVDRNFAANLPLNGRSFQSLIYMTPGVVPTAIGGGGFDSGQFSANGQRPSSNYWMVDGVSGNVASSTIIGGQGFGGAIGTTSVLGTTSSLVAVDAMQEFRVQTSTFSPEYGRTPGAQISIVTRSGGNTFHGSLFDYLRNDVLDANNWFNTFVTPNLPKAKERQNDFGGTFSGPVLKDRTFFFFSYEGLRLRVPETLLTDVPCTSLCTVFGDARLTAISAMKPYLNAYPLPNGPEVFNPCQSGTSGCPASGEMPTGSAEFNASYSNPATLDDYSLRVDHKLTETITLFGRYNYSPSQLFQRAPNQLVSLSSVGTSQVTAQQGTVGATWMISPRLVDEARFNYSRTNAFGGGYLDTFGGATPLSSLPFPDGVTNRNGLFELSEFSMLQGGLSTGPNVRNTQRQMNIVNNISEQLGEHRLKFGVDYRRLTPIFEPAQYLQGPDFDTVSGLQQGSPFGVFVESLVGATYLLQNLSLFAQDTWRVNPRFTTTFGVRWDTDFAPSTLTGPALVPIVGFHGLADLSQVAYGPPGAPFQARWGNFAPRLGVAYELSQKQTWSRVLRGGVGIFFDLTTSETENLILQAGYPYRAQAFKFGGSFPLPAQIAAPPPITAPTAASPGSLAGFDPSIQLPKTVEWNVALQQELGKDQSLTITYLGAAGRNLLQTVGVSRPTPALTFAELTYNGGSSDYDALQLQFNRRVAKGLQALASYTWSHSLDDGSAGSGGVTSNRPDSVNSGSNRGPSDFDVRHTFSGAFTYFVPALGQTSFVRHLTTGWSLQSFFQAHTAPPVSVSDGNFFLLPNGFGTAIRPDLSAGIPVYLYGHQYPGGKALNGAIGATTCPDGSASVGPFCPPPVDPTTGLPLRQGDTPRNAFRAFGLLQWDLGIHRDFRIHENSQLQFRAEMFNVLNHPNFAPPISDIATGSSFGQSQQLLAGYLSGSGAGAGTGGLSSLYSLGGPRSIQLGLHLSF